MIPYYCLLNVPAAGIFHRRHFNSRWKISSPINIGICQITLSLVLVAMANSTTTKSTPERGSPGKVAMLAYAASFLCNARLKTEAQTS